jgi:hypothetical protein
MDQPHIPKREPENEPMCCLKCGVMCSCPDAYRAHMPVCHNRNIVIFASHQPKPGQSLSYSKIRPR